MNTSLKFLTWLVFGSLATGCGTNIMPEVYLVPIQYQGPLIVLYNQVGYPALPRTGDSLVYDFRPNCVLRTSSPLLTGTGPTNAFQYYYVDAAGRRTHIRKVADWQVLRQLPPNEPCLITSAGLVSQNIVSEFLTSAQNFDYNDSISTHLLSTLSVGDTVSAPLR